MEVRKTQVGNEKGIQTGELTVRWGLVKGVDGVLHSGGDCGG